MIRHMRPLRKRIEKLVREQRLDATGVNPIEDYSVNNVGFCPRR